MASITLTNIKKVYETRKENVEAVKDFNLVIEDKEFVVLVGPSGCGKSTTLRMIAGLEDITDGELRIGETVVNDIAPKDRDIAMVFQNYALYPHMDVYQNMAFGLSLRKMKKKKIEARVNEAAKILDIEHLLGRKPKALSGGQRQRVALGRAIVRHPKVFLLDEPLSNLDAKLRNQMRAEISKLHNKVGVTFVYVTHDQTEAMTMADRIVVMKDGLIQQVGSPAELYSEPVNKFVAGFIGSPQMNFFTGTLTRSNGSVAVDLQGKTLELSEDKYTSGKLAEYIGKEVAVGIRPEDICESIEGQDVNTFEAEVEIAEMMGSETLVYLDFAGAKIISRFAPTTRVKSGDTVSFTVNTDQVHFFDTETEETIVN